MLPAAEFFPFLLPFVALILGVLACLVAEPLLSERVKHLALPWVALASLGLAGIALHFTTTGHIHGLFAIDPVRAVLVGILLVVATLGISALQQNLTEDGFSGGEPYALMLLATIGLGGMVLATNTIALFVSMELASLAIYPLVGLRRKSVLSSEALLKYFVMGAVFSGIFLYGASLLYGATGTTSYGGQIQPGRDSLHVLGFALMAVGLLFKAGAAPFHTWSPDAYSGAPSAVTGFMAGAVKIGAFSALGGLWIHWLASQCQVAPMAPIALAQYIPPQFLSWRPAEQLLLFHHIGIAFGVIGLLSILVGSLSLLGQRSLRRLTAYSGVVNAGFLVLALLLPSLFQGHVKLEVIWFYLAVYALSATGAMACLSVLAGKDDEGDHLSSLAGAARRQPLVGAALSVFLASLAGLPPAAGFIAKFQVLTGLMLSAAEPRLIAIPALALLLALVAAAGYLRVLIVVWSQPGPGTEPARQPGTLLAWSLSLVAFVVLILSVGPQILFRG